jgi:MFS family permease
MEGKAAGHWYDLWPRVYLTAGRDAPANSVRDAIRLQRSEPAPIHRPLMTERDPVDARAAFRHRDFRLSLGANVASVLAIQMQSVAIGWQVYELTHRPLDLGLVGLAQFLPAISLSLPAGQTADRYDRRAILRICQLAQGLCVVLLWLELRLGVPSVAPIYAVLVLFGTARAFNAPASQAFLPHLVPAEDFPNAVTWAHSVRQVATIAGPAIGGLIYGVSGGAAAVYGTCAALYLFAFALTTLIEARTGRLQKEAITFETLLAGVRYVWRQKIVLGCISLDLFAVLLGGAVALLPVYARDILHTGPLGLGLLRTAPAVGAAAMGALLAYHPLRRRVGHRMFVAVAVFGISTIVFGVSRTFALSMAVLAVAGAADMVSVVIRLTLVQLSTPPSMRGRVSAVNMAFINASNELGEFESGVTAALFGTVPAVIIGGAGTCLVVAIWALLFPEIRKLETLSGEGLPTTLEQDPVSLSRSSPARDTGAAWSRHVVPPPGRTPPGHSK